MFKYGCSCSSVCRHRPRNDYACYRGRLGWYVKVYESDDGLAVISHHEPEQPLVTITGQMIYPMKPSSSGSAALNEDGNGHS